MARIPSRLEIREARGRRAPTATPVVAAPTPGPIEEATALPSVVHEENEAGPPPINDNQPANFAPNEIAIPGGATTTSPNISELIGANDFEDDLRRATILSTDAERQKLAERVVGILHELQD